MVIDPMSIIEFLLSVFLFPTLFQIELVKFAWGASDPFWIMAAKRILLLLPAVAAIAASWTVVPSLLTVIFRTKRTQFITGLVLTWWDLGKALLYFWGGG